MIQAKSLAKVVDLADNPPLKYEYGSRRTQEKSLVLYIARVPGSRDIFLTTIKPLDKVVRAEDVQSCLYYVHLDCERDAQLLQGEEQQLEGGDSEEDLPLGQEKMKKEDPVVRRKPVSANTTALDLLDRSTRPPRTYSDNRTASSNVEPLEWILRKPVIRETLRSAPAVQTRKVLEPRPMADSLAAMNAVGTHSLSSNERREDIPPDMSQPPSSARDLAHAQKQHDFDRLYQASMSTTRNDPERNCIRSSYAHGIGDSPPNAASADKTGRSLTLIRRYNNSQSNVCRIDAQGNLEVCSLGYGKYSVADCAEENGTAPFIGKRKSGWEPFRTAVQQRHQSDMSRPLPKPGVLDDPRMQGSNSNSLDVHRYSQQFSDTTNLHRQKNCGEQTSTAKHFMFKTPWGSTCRFVLGVGGRSFKCKHSSRTVPGSIILSELRFNLPSSQALQSPPRLPSMAGPLDAKRKSLLGVHQRGKSSSSQENQPAIPAVVSESFDEVRMDLSLGQEPAGGGFGGKQAKLGKLIIEPGGFQMLDLLVAANVTMWWKVYDKYV